MWTAEQAVTEPNAFELTMVLLCWFVWRKSEFEPFKGYIKGFKANIQVFHSTSNLSLTGQEEAHQNNANKHEYLQTNHMLTWEVKMYCCCNQ